MKYAILELDHQMESKCIIRFVDTVDEFTSYVISESPNANIVESIGISDLSNSCFKNLDYLLFSVDRKSIKLVKKYTTKNIGTIYSSDKMVVDLIKTFEMIPIDKDEIVEDRIAVDEFRLNEMKPNPSILIIGKRGSGSTTIVSNILDTKSREFISNSLIICQMDADYRDLYPDAAIVNKYDSNLVLSALCDKQEGAIVLDDAISEYVKNDVLIDLILNPHHYNKTLIITMRYPLGIRPELRSSFDYVFLLHEDSISNQKRLYENYTGFFPDFDSFRQVFGELTQNYASMVIKNSINTASMSDKIWYFKARVKN